MMRAALVLCLLPSLVFGQESDGGTPQVAELVKGVITTDAGYSAVYGGCWLSEAKCIDTAKEKAGYEARIAALEAQPPPMSLSVVLACVGGAVALGLAGGVVIGYTVKK